jgi:hypothetical protein
MQFEPKYVFTPYQRLVATFSGKIKNREMIFKNENDYKNDRETTITKNLEN